jgi:hypothetical protein
MPDFVGVNKVSAYANIASAGKLAPLLAAIPTRCDRIGTTAVCLNVRRKQRFIS